MKGFFIFIYPAVLLGIAMAVPGIVKLARNALRTFHTTNALVVALDDEGLTLNKRIMDAGADIGSVFISVYMNRAS